MGLLEFWIQIPGQSTVQAIRVFPGLVEVIATAQHQPTSCDGKRGIFDDGSTYSWLFSRTSFQSVGASTKDTGIVECRVSESRVDGFLMFLKGVIGRRGQKKFLGSAQI